MAGDPNVRTTEGPGPEEVAAWLREHPDFLAQRPELAALLTPPRLERGKGVLDFQAFMLERLREELAQVKDQQRELLATSRANLNSQNRIHAAVLFLLDARSFEQFIQTVTTELAVLLDLDVAALVVESNGRETPHVHASGVRVVPPGTVEELLGRRPVLLRSDIQGDPEIYGQGAGLVRSEALLRLRVSDDTPAGLLAFGSREPDMFHSGQGTELVCFLARVVERCIRSWLDLPTA
ncbi:DUF484 family protein [Arenibaculum pallidiluteum]|uniref:DUF484 family protein n=1 Tax=Arenibaculum pallidiluteum TaxID=2812559 RepID=UPI001A97936F|nr:DUF484 family protein [Arenibaculum pallidiluteum]